MSITVASIVFGNNPKESKVYLSNGSELGCVVSVKATAGVRECTTATIEVVLMNPIDGTVGEIGRGGQKV